MNEKTPLIRIAKKEEVSMKKAWLIKIAAFIVALLLGCFAFIACDVNPFEAYFILFSKTLGKASGIKQVVRSMIPLLGTALALAPCFKMRYWNIGAEGQITMGAIGASWVAYTCTSLPRPILLILMAVAAMVFGGFWASVPAFFKSRWNTNETLFTLTMNYIAIGIAAWLVGGPWEGVAGSQIAPMFDKKAVLPKVFGLQIGWIIVLLLVGFMFVYLTYTKHGYEVSVLGESENTARYAGMNVRMVIVRTAILSGAIAGLVGYLIASGSSGTIYSDCAGGVGFTAITVAWLAKLNPFVMILISMLLAVLSRGGSALATYMNTPVALSDILSGLILLCMLGCEFFLSYRFIIRGHEEKEAK